MKNDCIAFFMDMLYYHPYIIFNLIRQPHVTGKITAEGISMKVS